jgi:hypothetical protein
VTIRSCATIATLALAIAGLALPAAGAATRPGGRTNDTSDVVSRYLSSRANDTSDVVSRYLSSRANDTSDVVSRYVANVIRASPAASAQQPTLASSDGFDWSAALIGAGGALAIVLLLGATIGVIRHRHSHLKRRIGTTAFSGRRAL